MQFRASASLLIIVILSLDSLVSQLMPVAAQRAAGNAHSPVLPMQAASAMNEKELVDMYLEVLRETQSNVNVVRGFTGQSQQLPMVIQYTEGGVPMTEYITVAPIERRESLLLIVHALPSATSTQYRGDLEELVTLDVSSRETASQNPSITESGGSERSEAQQVVPSENDSEMVFDDVYTVPVYCEDVTEGSPFSIGRVVYGSCEWPVPVLGSRASCIEDDSLVYQGQQYLSKPRGGDSGQAHPNEVTLQNAPERIYTMEVTCERVKDQFGITTEVCDWPLYMTGSPECIEDRLGSWGNRRVYLCEP